MQNRRIALSIWFVVLPALLFGTLGVLAPLRLEELGFTAVAIGVLWLCTAALEAIVNPLIGRVSDRIGRFGPMRASVFLSAIVAALLPWPDRSWLLAALVVAGGLAFGSFWTPAMALSRTRRRRAGSGTDTPSRSSASPGHRGRRSARPAAAPWPR